MLFGCCVMFCISSLIKECELCPNLGGIFKETLHGQ